MSQSLKAAAAARALARARADMQPAGRPQGLSRWGQPSAPGSRMPHGMNANSPQGPQFSHQQTTAGGHRAFGAPQTVQYQGQFAMQQHLPQSRPFMSPRGPHGFPTQPNGTHAPTFQQYQAPMGMFPNNGRPRHGMLQPVLPQGGNMFGRPPAMMSGFPHGVRPPQVPMAPRGMPPGMRPGLPPGVQPPRATPGQLAARPLTFVASGAAQPSNATPAAPTAGRPGLPPGVTYGHAGHPAGQGVARPPMMTLSSSLSSSSASAPASAPQAQGALHLPPSDAAAPGGALHGDTATASSAPQHAAVGDVETARLSVWVGKLPPTDVVPGEVVRTAIQRASRVGKFGTFGWERAGQPLSTTASLHRGHKGARQPLKGFGFVTVEGALAAARLCSLDGLKLWEAHPDGLEKGSELLQEGEPWSQGISVKLGKEAEIVLGEWARQRSAQAREERARARQEAREQKDGTDCAVVPQIDGDGGQPTDDASGDKYTPSTASAGVGSSTEGAELPVASRDPEPNASVVEAETAEDLTDKHFSNFVDGEGTLALALQGACAAFEEVFRREGVYKHNPVMEARAGDVSHFRRLAEKDDQQKQNERSRRAEWMAARRKSESESAASLSAAARDSSRSQSKAASDAQKANKPEGSSSQQQYLHPRAETRVAAAVDSRFVDDDSDSEEDVAQKDGVTVTGAVEAAAVVDGELQQKGASTGADGPLQPANAGAGATASHCIPSGAAIQIDTGIADGVVVAVAGNKRARDSGATSTNVSGSLNESAPTKRPKTDEPRSQAPPQLALDEVSVRARVQSGVGPFLVQLLSEDSTDGAAQSADSAPDQEYSEDVKVFLDYVADIAVGAATKVSKGLAHAELQQIRAECNASLVEEFGEIFGVPEAAQIAGILWVKALGQDRID